MKAKSINETIRKSAQILPECDNDFGLVKKTADEMYSAIRDATIQTTKFAGDQLSGYVLQS